jgi:hypothetical protein
MEIKRKGKEEEEEEEKKKKKKKRCNDISEFIPFL